MSQTTAPYHHSRALGNMGGFSSHTTVQLPLSCLLPFPAGWLFCYDDPKIYTYIHTYNIDYWCHSGRSARDLLLLRRCFYKGRRHELCIVWLPWTSYSASAPPALHIRQNATVWRKQMGHGEKGEHIFDSIERVNSKYSTMDMVFSKQGELRSFAIAVSD